MASKEFRRVLKGEARKAWSAKIKKPEGPPNTEHKGTDYQSIIDANRRANERLYFKGKKDE
jgi:hypothetical protein